MADKDKINGGDSTKETTVEITEETIQKDDSQSQKRS